MDGVAGTIGSLAWGFISAAIADQMDTDNATEAMIRRHLIGEMGQLKESLSSIRMKELRSAEMNLKTGMTLYGSNPAKAEPEFTEARRNAVMAIGVVETIEDKINAVKTGIVAAFFEFGAGTEDFQRVTKVYLDALNTASEVTQSCALLFRKDVRSKMQKLVLSHKKAQDLLCEVVQINNNLMVLMVRYTKIDRKTLLLSWPVFQFGGTQMHPITEAYKILGIEMEIYAMTTIDKYFFTAGQDKALRVWSLETLEFLQDLRGHSGFVRCLEVAPGVAQAEMANSGNLDAVVPGHTLFSAGTDQSIKVWRLQASKTGLKWRCKKSLTTHHAPVTCLKLAEHLLFSTSSDMTINVWSIQRLDRPVATHKIDFIPFTILVSQVTIEEQNEELLDAEEPEVNLTDDEVNESDVGSSQKSLTPVTEDVIDTSEKSPLMKAKKKNKLTKPFKKNTKKLAARPARRETFMESIRRRETSFSFASSKTAAASAVADFLLCGEDKFNFMTLSGREMAETGSWEFKTIAAINTWRSTGSPNLNFIPFLAAGPYLFVPSQTRIFLYDAEKLLPGAPPKPKDQLKGHKDTILAIAAYKNWVFTGSKDGEVKVWSLKRLTSTHAFKMKFGSVFSLAVHVEGKEEHEVIRYILAGCTNCSLVRIPFNQKASTGGFDWRKCCCGCCGGQDVGEPEYFPTDNIVPKVIDFGTFADMRKS